jgi:hypothetical protein
MEKVVKENLAKVIVLTIDAMYLVVRCEFHLNITMLLNLGISTFFNYVNIV